jgi:hypothetical protein
MAQSLRDELAKLEPDPWRASVGFSPDIIDAHRVLFGDGAKSDAKVIALNEWLQEYQPCLFGRIAAKRDLISFCIIDEADLRTSDEYVRDKIQEARRSWNKETFDGRKSAFVLLVLSPTIAFSIPNESVRELARKVCSLYLLKDIATNTIYLDEVFLEVPGQSQATFVWPAGVNYFSSQGDQRWWHDHRIPGGLAFSVNSVGHMVKSGKLANAMDSIREISESFNDGPIASKVDSLPKALYLAMRTISKASETTSGRATWLIPLTDQDSAFANQSCPVELPSSLSTMSFCEYRGGYHTDQTIPGEYFEPSKERSSHLPVHKLDFTYLFDDSIDNPDFATMGKGRRIRSSRSSGHSRKAGATMAANVKRECRAAKIIAIAENARLTNSLKPRER